jgi:hypothetical protein
VRLAIVIACLVFVPLAGCAARQRKTCCLIAGAVGLAALIGIGDGLINDAIDREPTHTDTSEGQLKHWEWEQRQLQNSLPSPGF